MEICLRHYAVFRDSNTSRSLTNSIKSSLLRIDRFTIRILDLVSSSSRFVQSTLNRDLISVDFGLVGFFSSVGESDETFGGTIEEERKDQ